MASYIVAKCNPSNHRYYDDTDLRQLHGIKEQNRKTVVYCRVSSNGQKDSFLAKENGCEIIVVNHPGKNW